MKCPTCGETIYALVVGMPGNARPPLVGRRYCCKCDKVYRIRMEVEC